MMTPHNVFRGARFLLAFAAGLLAGCGGGTQDYGSFNRSLNGDISPGYNTSIAGRYGNGQNGREAALRGTYKKIEASFELPKIPGDPFDFEAVNVQVTVRKPDGGTVDVPAFFDGGTTWRMRYTPAAPGLYAVVKVTLNRETASESKLQPKDWTVKGEPAPGFIRVDRGDRTRFVFDSGARYYPLGNNVAWGDGTAESITRKFPKMHEAGENWSRIWMNHWDGKNLDWTTGGKQGKLGELNLDAAKKWDTIVDEAEKNGIYFQMTLQHHGQYSSQKGYRYSNNNNSNWEENPYNVKNGGFLQNPEDFFTNKQARALTKRKLYYILARWGYSPNVMAWELFNEVEGSDAGNGKLWDDIGMWHKEMTIFLKQFDRYQHLVTTSAPNLTAPVWESVDYIQQHTYPPDVITAVGGAMLTEAKRLNKPIFFGEFGPSNLKDPEGVTLHDGLWSSLMSGMSGAAQYWDWEQVEKSNLYAQYTPVSGFLTASGMANQGGLQVTNLPVETTERAALRFGPGGGWANASQSEFVVGENGAPAGIDGFPSFLQGQAHRTMMPKPLTFQVNYRQSGAFAVTVAQVAKSGAALKITVDGGSAATKTFAESSSGDYRPKADEDELQVKVPAGAHTITVENTGSDWVVVRRFALANYSAALAAPAKVGKDFAVAWVYHRDNVDKASASLTPASGRLSLPGLKKGKYRAVWWDTRTGKSTEDADLTVASDKEPASLNIPPVTRDLALYVTKAGPAGNAEQEPRARKEQARGENPGEKGPLTAPPTTLSPK